MTDRSFYMLASVCLLDHIVAHNSVKATIDVEFVIKNDCAVPKSREVCPQVRRRLHHLQIFNFILKVCKNSNQTNLFIFYVILVIIF